MTKEEAIKLIDDRMCFGRGKWSEHHQPEIDVYWQAGEMAIKALEAEPHEIGYDECANALLKMWMDNVLSDWVYHRIIDKLNEKWGKTELPKSFKEVTE